MTYKSSTFTTRGLVIYSTRGHGFHGTFQKTKHLQLDELSIRQVLSALSSDDQGSFKIPTKKALIHPEVYR